MQCWFVILTLRTVMQPRCKTVNCTAIRLFVDPDIMSLARQGNVLSEANGIFLYFLKSTQVSPLNYLLANQSLKR